MPRGTTITIPDEIDVAIRAEAYRLGCRPAEVLVLWLRETFPDFVRDQLRDDLDHPQRNVIIDVTAKTATPPAATDGVVHLNELTTQATQILPPGDLIAEDPSGGCSPD